MQHTCCTDPYRATALSLNPFWPAALLATATPASRCSACLAAAMRLGSVAASPIPRSSLTLLVNLEGRCLPFLRHRSGAKFAFSMEKLLTIQPHFQLCPLHRAGRRRLCHRRQRRPCQILGRRSRRQHFRLSCQQRFRPSYRFLRRRACQLARRQPFRFRVQTAIRQCHRLTCQRRCRVRIRRLTYRLRRHLSPHRALPAVNWP